MGNFSRFGGRWRCARRGGSAEGVWISWATKGAWPARVSPTVGRTYSNFISSTGERANFFLYSPSAVYHPGLPVSEPAHRIRLPAVPHLFSRSSPLVRYLLP